MKDKKIVRTIRLQGSYYPVDPAKDFSAFHSRVDFVARRVIYKRKMGNGKFYEYGAEKIMYAGEMREVEASTVAIIRAHLKEALADFYAGEWSYPVVIKEAQIENKLDLKKKLR